MATKEDGEKGQKINDPTLVEWKPRFVYVGCAINLPGKPQGAIQVAQRIAAEVQLATGCKVTSHWMHDPMHYARGYGQAAALADLVDIANSDYVVVVPLTKTSRGCHVEYGFAYGLGKPVHIVAPVDRDPTAFDYLALPAPQEIVDAVQRALEWAELDIKVRSFS